MRVLAGTKEAEKVVDVFVNGKRVLQVVEFDTVEGWVDQLVPAEVVEVKGAAGALEGIPTEWKKQRLTGQVKVLCKP